MNTKQIKTYKAIVKDFNEKDFTANVIVSTASVDRDGDIIHPDAFKKRLKDYKNHPVLLSSHSYSDLTKQIGEAKTVKVTEDGLETKFEWYVGKGNPEADWGWFLATKGIAAFSVGFMPFTWEDGEYKDGEFKGGVRRKFTEVELVEVSQVLIPSNRDAVMGRRGKDEGITGEMVELAIKAMGWESKKCDKCGFDVAVSKSGGEYCGCKPEESKDDVNQDKSSNSEPEEKEGATHTLAKEIILDTLKKGFPEFKELVKQVVAEILAEKKAENPTADNSEEKSYIDILLGNGAQQKPDQIPTKESLSDMIREVVQEQMR